MGNLFKISENVIFFQTHPLPKDRKIQSENISEKDLLSWEWEDPNFSTSNGTMPYRGRGYDLHEHVGAYFKTNGIFWD